MMRLLIALLLACSLQAATVKTVCASGCDYTGLQAAIDAASYGWVIEMTAGQTFATYAVQLKAKTGTPAYIVIRSSRAGELAGGVRVTPSDTAKMAKLSLSNAGYALITAEQGAAYYRFEGLEFTLGTGIEGAINLIQLGTIGTWGSLLDHELSDLPHHLIFDRCYIHGNPGENGPNRGVMANTGYFELTDSWIGEIHYDSGEGQAIVGWNGSGPFVIRNNHLEDADIITMFGGAGPNIPGLRATGLTYLGNHYYKPWKWRVQDATAAPTGTCLWDARGGEFKHDTVGAKYYECQSGTWTEILVGAYPSYVYWNKNAFELKNASRVLADGNLIENGWLPTAQGQHGAAFLFNQVDSSNGENAAVIEWVQVQNNLVKNTPWGVSNGVLDRANYFHLTHDISVDNNLWTGIGEEPQSLDDPAWVQTTATRRVGYTRNTVVSAKASGTGASVHMDAAGTDEPIMAGNILPYLASGFYSGTDGGNLWNGVDTAWALNRSFARNVVVDTMDARHGAYDFPEVNLLTVSDSPRSQQKPCPTCAVGTITGGPQSYENGGTNDVGFTDYAGGDYRLAGTSLYKGWGPLGQDAGADIDVVEWSTDAVSAGGLNPYLDFRVRALKVRSTTADLRYTAYSTAACTPTLSLKADYSSPAYNTASGTGNRDRLAQITGLSANTRYFYKVVCDGAYRRSGVLNTMIEPATSAPAPTRIIIRGRVTWRTQ